MLHQADLRRTDLFQCTSTQCVPLITPFPSPLGFAMYLTGLGYMLAKS